MRLGFIGAGAIASCLVTGFCGGEVKHSICVSPRNREKAAALQAAFPDQVRVAESNQQVVDQSDWLFLCVRPQLAPAVISSLCFRPEHQVISLLSDQDLSLVSQWVGPVALLARAVPMSFNAQRFGPIVLYPDLPPPRQLLNQVGQVVGVEREEQAQTLLALTAVQASFFTLLHDMTLWGEHNGVERETAIQYLSAMFQAFCREAQDIEASALGELAQKMTPGGLNWMVKTALTDSGALGQWTQALDRVMHRLQPIAGRKQPDKPQQTNISNI